jgi:hypothetical protein
MRRKLAFIAMASFGNPTWNHGWFRMPTANSRAKEKT